MTATIDRMRCVLCVSVCFTPDSSRPWASYCGPPNEVRQTPFILGLLGELIYCIWGFRKGAVLTTAKNSRHKRIYPSRRWPPKSPYQPFLAGVRWNGEVKGRGWRVWIGALAAGEKLHGDRKAGYLTTLERDHAVERRRQWQASGQGRPGTRPGQGLRPMGGGISFW